MKEKLQEIRDMLYAVNAQNISLRMIGLKQRDDGIVGDTNACIVEIIRRMDALIRGADPAEHIVAVEGEREEAIRFVQKLLGCCELNLDDMEPGTREVVREASSWVSSYEGDCE